MTQAPLEPLDRQEITFEKIDRKLNVLTAELVEMKISQGRIEERPERTTLKTPL